MENKKDMENGKFKWEEFCAHVAADECDNDAVRAANSQLDHRYARGCRFTKARLHKKKNHDDRIVVVAKYSGMEIFPDGRFSSHDFSIRWNPVAWLEIMGKWQHNEPAPRIGNI